MINFKKYKINLDMISKSLFILSLSILIFGYGFISGRNRLFPYYLITYNYNKVIEFINKSKPHHLFPIRFKESGAKIHNPDKVMPGVTLLTSYWSETEWTAGIRLIDLEGKILHHWEVKANDIWPESPHDDLAKNLKNKNNNYVHGTYLYPNGDIILSISFLGLVRMNSSGDIIWKLPYRTHHSVFQDEDGNFWVSGAKWIESGNDREKLFPGLNPPYVEETIIKVSPEGIILKEISLLESLYNGNYQHLLHNYFLLHGDLLHLNDVEVLSSELAKEFPTLDSGDIVMSSRHLNSITILDQNGIIKWMCTGVFTKQHDPDFEQNGWITVFDNRSNIDRTMIRSINPATNKVKTLYPTNPDQAFYTEAGGKHQKLANGNRLITEARAGRIFEISPQGETVWEWIHQPYDNEYVPEVLEGTRYNIEINNIAKWKKDNSNYN